MLTKIKKCIVFLLILTTLVSFHSLSTPGAAAKTEVLSNRTFYIEVSIRRTAAIALNSQTSLQNKKGSGRSSTCAIQKGPSRDISENTRFPPTITTGPCTQKAESITPI